MSKQTRDAAVLVLLLGVLIVMGVITIRGMSKQAPTPPPPPRAATPSTTAKPGTASPTVPAAATATAVPDEGDQLAWVSTDPRYLKTLVGQVDGGRNPFINVTPDTATLVGVPSTTPSKKGSQGKTGMTNPIPIPPGSDIYSGLPGTVEEAPKSQVVALKWVTPADVIQTLSANEALNDVKVSLYGKTGDAVTVKGPGMDVDLAVQEIKKLDVEPPVPQFTVVGIIMMPGHRYASIGLGGTYYTLSVGQMIPSVGWTITRITPTGVTLEKDRQSIHVRLSGGSLS